MQIMEINPKRGGAMKKIIWGIIPGEGIVPILNIAKLQESMESLNSETVQ